MKDKNCKLRKLISDYYKDYYKIQLGLPDWRERVALRIDEEDVYCSRFVNWIEEWVNYSFFRKKVLIVGCGTGGELIKLTKKGSEVFAIEPNEKALEICHIKCEKENIPVKNVMNAYSENLPFDSNTFDFVYCFTVLEHVEDVNLSIQEMVRCVKLDGKVFIQTPDYRQLYEGHYKLPLPMFLPIWFNKIILRALGRPTKFLSTINKVNSRVLLEKFSDLPVTALRVYKDEVKNTPLFSFRLGYVAQLVQFLIYKLFKIEGNQIWILHKTNTRRGD